MREAIAEAHERVLVRHGAAGQTPVGESIYKVAKRKSRSKEHSNVSKGHDVIVLISFKASLFGSSIILQYR